MTPEDLIAALKPLEGHWARVVYPGPPVPFVQDFPVAEIRPLSEEQANDETRAVGCDVIIWAGRFVGGGDTLSGWALPSAKVAEATWHDEGRSLKLRKKRSRRVTWIRILDPLAQRPPEGYNEWVESAHG